MTKVYQVIDLVKKVKKNNKGNKASLTTCLLYTSDAADDLLCVDLGGRRILKKSTRLLPMHHKTFYAAF